ncbi:MAG TPA: 16S rRNA (guanine(966)-N(2))-methyltransferase RsmD [Gammaproteobacteria bacterium]|nr:16S rRNA (guanine(966)-N(2))-methyltransferase RsmD [Gammaproteobacteria bacterium]
MRAATQAAWCLSQVIESREIVAMHNSGPGYRNEFRIIGGEWRRRRLGFPPLPDIRPSPDRVRETLFNWLQGRVPGAHCLDLFAGSGALGLEALSRGAADCVFVDQARAVIETLRSHFDSLQAQGAEAVQSEALLFLERNHQRFDLVFLDPPFASDLLERTLEILSAGAWLAPDARIYIEYAAARCPALPAGWRMLREARAGRVGFGLAIAAELPRRPTPTYPTVEE